MKEMLESLFLSIKYSIKDIIILPGDNLDNVLKLACLIAGISTATYWLGLPTFIDCRGAWVGCLILFIVTSTGRRKVHEISRSDGNDTVSDEVDGSR